MNGEIPALKAKAEWLPWALQCFRDHNGDYRKIEDCILTKWQKASQRTKSPSTRNSLRAVFGPSLRHLQLIMGEHDKLQLMSKGNELLRVYDDLGEAEFKKAFAKHLVKLDKERWGGVIFEIQNLGGNITSEKLSDALESRQQGRNIKDKIRKVLLYYEYVGLVHIEGESVKLRERVLEAITKGLNVRISDSQFLEVMFSAYEKLHAKAGGNPYVAIPEIREEVCGVLGLWPDDFYEILRKIPKETSEYLIHLSQPMVRKPGGIKLGEKYLYYLAINKKEKGD